MRKRHYHRPHHESPQELRLWAIVDSLVTDISEKEAYLAFARELAVTERFSSFVHRPSMRKPGTVLLWGQTFGKRGQSRGVGARVGKAGTVPGSRTGPCEGTVPVFPRDGARHSPRFPHAHLCPLGVKTSQTPPAFGVPGGYPPADRPKHECLGGEARTSSQSAGRAGFDRHASQARMTLYWRIRRRFALR
jgi:hypothetical protein